MEPPLQKGIWSFSVQMLYMIIQIFACGKCTPLRLRKIEKSSPLCETATKCSSSSTHTHNGKKSVSPFSHFFDRERFFKDRSIMEISEETGNAIAGIVSGAVAVMLFNPIDCLRIRWQVCPRRGRSRTNIVKLRGVSLERRD